MSAHRSAPIERVEVITRGARRRWSMTEKRAIVAESLVPGAVGAAICRRHEISSGQLSTWRRQCRDDVRDTAGVMMPIFARAMVMPQPADLAPEPVPILSSSPPPPKPHRTPRRRTGGRATSGGEIEIALPDGTVVRVGTAVDQAALTRVLAALRGE